MIATSHSQGNPHCVFLAQFFMLVWLIFTAWSIAGFMVIPMWIALLAVIVFPEIALFLPRIFSPEVIN